MTTALTVASIQQACKQLRLPAIAGQCGPLAEAAERERQPYLGYLEALLGAELEEREQHTVARRLREAHLPRLKTLRRLRLSPSGGLFQLPYWAASSRTGSLLRISWRARANKLRRWRFES